jgi:acetyltransferase
MARYPQELERSIRLSDGATVRIRPIRPADREMEQAFVQGLSRESRYFRFLDTLSQLSPQMLQHFTDIDYDRHMAFIALSDDSGSEREIGVTRYIVTDSNDICEFAIVVADAWQRRGLGRALMRCLLAVARSRGLKTMYGDVLASNQAMLRFMRGLGFRADPCPEDPKLRRLVFDLQAMDDSSPDVTPAT